MLQKYSAASIFGNVIKLYQRWPMALVLFLSIFASKGSDRKGERQSKILLRDFQDWAEKHLHSLKRGHEMHHRRCTLSTRHRKIEPFLLNL